MSPTLFHTLRTTVIKEEDSWQAKSLLYETYCEEMGWFPSPNNPSELRVEDYRGAKILEDKFPQVSIWMGVFNLQNELVGCARVSGRHPVTQQIDMMDYMPEGSKFVFENIDSDGLCEASRMAVRKAYRYKGVVFLMLLKKAIEIACANRTTIFVTNAGRSWEILRKYATNTGVEFSYEERDPCPVKLSVIHLKDMERLLGEISRDIALIVGYGFPREKLVAHARL